MIERLSHPLILWSLAVVATAVAALSVAMLERREAGLIVEARAIGETPATLYRPAGAPRPLVIVAHGFAGSRQMMEPISLALATAGHAVLAFDFIGHGRHRHPLSARVNEIDGTTAQLVDQTRRVAAAARDWPGVGPPMALVGHSMATDVVIRAAREIDGIEAVVAISMYSEAVTATHPERLLIVSGAAEDRLRDVALEAVRLVAPEAEEGETVRAGAVARRAVAAPGVGHVGVLYSPATHRELGAWIGSTEDAPPVSGATAPWLLALLTSLTVLLWPVSRILPRRAETPEPMPLRRFLLALLVPPVPAAAAALVLGGSVLGLAAFGRLVLFFGVWGGIALALMPRDRFRGALAPAGLALLLVWALGIFGLALDRYGAAFLPVGPRLPLMAVLAAGTVPFMLSDALLTLGAPIWRRLAVRALPVVALTAAMLLAPAKLGLVFTTVPVLVLFYLVHGLMGRWVGLRSGALTSGLGLGLVLAWAIAASTPLFEPLPDDVPPPDLLSG